MTIKQTIFLLFLFGAFLGCRNNQLPLKIVQQEEILVTPLPKTLDAIQGTRTRFFLSAIDDQLNNVKFSALALPPFIKLVDNTNGSGELVIDAPQNQTGQFPIQLLVQNAKNKSPISLTIKLEKGKGPIFYCDPSIKENTGTGTIDNPFSSLARLMASDFSPPENSLILLLSGAHGAPIIYAKNITIAAANGQHPSLDKLVFNSADAVTMSGVTIGKVSKIKAKPKTKRSFVVIDSLSTNITIQNCLIQIAENTANWTEDDWTNKATNGILAQGKNSLIRYNLIRNIFHGIETENEDIIIEYNTVDRFSGDAIRNISSNNIYRFNLLKNAVLDDYYAPNGNHDDLFQSWTFDKPIENIRLENNIAISCLEPDLPLRSKIVQGIVCFDGFENNWLIKNNLVLTDHPHGIALYGAKDCTISHNTVLRNPYKFAEFESPPWIMINDHKDKRKSTNNVVDSNIVSALNIVSADVKMTFNKTIKADNTTYLKDYEGWDFRVAQ